MSNKFSIAPQTVTIGTPTNNVVLTFYYDFADHSICKIRVTPTGTLAAETMAQFARNGMYTVQTTTIPAQDTATAIPLELNPSELVTPHGPAFGV